jgi:putative ABC transport system substrate-binding protein
MKKLLTISFIALSLVCSGIYPVAASAQKTVYMTVWRGCEEACEAFKEYFANKGMDVQIVVRDAKRDKKVLSQFVKEARELKADLVVTWGTSVTLGMVGTLKDAGNPRFINDIPIVFMIVADPIGAGIIKSYAKTGRTNVAGTRNRVPETVNIKTIRSYRPGFKRLGMLYNSNEKNSILKVEEMRALTQKMKFELVALQLELGADGHPKSESIPAKMAELKEKGVDFVYLGSSSFLRKNGDVFTESAIKNDLPVLSPYESLVKKSHALLSVSARYADVGRLAAQQAQKILFEGATPGDLPVIGVKEFAYVVNMATARKLNLFPPMQVLKYAETVN